MDDLARRLAKERAVPATAIGELSERSRDVFRRIVEAYLETGEPVGSRTLSRRLGQQLSPATIRNTMADLQEVGLLYAPHTSAGRLPTEAGLRLFVSGLLGVGGLTEEERASIDGRCATAGKSLAQLLDTTSVMLSGLSHCASLVLAPKRDDPLRHIEFVNLGPGRALVVLVTQTGLVENRLIEVPLGVPPSALVQATNYLNARLTGRTIEEARGSVLEEIELSRAELDELSSKVVENGLAIWSGSDDPGYLIVRGQANLLGDVTGVEDLERIRGLFETLETKETAMRLLDSAQSAEGVQIFIGSGNELFAMAGCSLIVAPYQNSQERVVGAIGVIGPTRLNYARIIPMVDYTAKVIGRLLG